MHVVLLNQFFPPSGAPTGKLLYDVAQRLRERGHKITVITSRGSYGMGESDGSAPEMDGIVVLRLGSLRRHRTGYLAKLLDYVVYFKNASSAVFACMPRPDVLVSMTTPPFCGLIAARLKRKKGIPYLLWTMDLYPEALSANGGLIGLSLCNVLTGLSRREREGASAVITLGADMTERILQTTPAAHAVEVPVWSQVQPSLESIEAAKVLRIARGWGPDERILMYSGNMGRAHRADEFAALATRLRQRSIPARVVFCGEGPSKAEWIQKWPDCFEWLPAVDNNLLAAHLLSADIHLIGLQPDWAGIVVPSKYQTACALGRPVLFAGPERSAVADWIQSGDTGWLLPPDDIPAVERVSEALLDIAVLRRTGEHALAQNVQLFDRTQQVNHVVGQIERAGCEQT